MSTHIAILGKSWHLLEKIQNGQKTIESRWYKMKVAPWNNVFASETVYFKEAGDPVKVKATIEKVLQFELSDQVTRDIITHFGDKICLSTKIKPNDPLPEYYNGRKYCILIFLKDVQPVEPFYVDKTGYGISSAWLVIPDSKPLPKLI